MRLSPQRIKALQDLLKEQLGVSYTDEEAQAAGLAIMRFIVAKHRRSNELTDNEGTKDEVEQKDTNST